jgi:serine protease Do
VRYADGSVVHTKVGHRDKIWDLALLIPLSGRWTDGLVASMTSPADIALEAPVATRPGRPAVVPAHLRGVLDARAKDSTDVLRAALDVELRNATPTVGAPVTDTSGGVVGVFIRACQATLPTVPSGAGGPPPPPPPCSPIVVGAPVAATPGHTE